MIRIGIDIVEIARLERAMDRWQALAKRLFTENELAYAARGARPAERLAARFAAKEAAFKALSTGWPALSWHDVEVVSMGGQPSLKLAGRAKKLLGEDLAAVSLSHDAGLATAQVLLWSQK